MVLEAAGGVVWRVTSKGRRKVLLVHRPRYRDWTIPKGKLDPGETASAAALREVEEETGLRCRLGPRLPSVRYTDARGRPKRVRYWAMTVEEGGAPPEGFSPNDEVEEIAWLRVPEALDRLTYAHDRPVLEALEGALADTDGGT